MRGPFHLRIPGTSANLGPGFDAAGLALGLYNELTVTPTRSAEIIVEVSGEGVGQVDPHHNLIVDAYRRTFARLHKAVPGARLESFNRIPFARGMGSSSAAIVAGIAAAHMVSGQPLSTQEAISLATAMDGHPDNVLPAILGGICLGCQDSHARVYWHKITPPAGLQATVLIPEYALATAKARQVMPDSYSRADAVYNLSHYGLAVAAFMSGDLDLLKEALKDRMHEPYRLPLMPGMAELRQMALDAGALAAPVSGAGSTVLVLSDQTIDTTPLIQWAASRDISLRTLALPIVGRGVYLIDDNETEMVVWP